MKITSGKTKTLYNQRTWLNTEKSSGTGSTTGYYGFVKWSDHIKGPWSVNAFFEVADCHQTARIHKIDSEPFEDYVAKIRLLADEAAKYADFLEEELKKQKPGNK